MNEERQPTSYYSIEIRKTQQQLSDIINNCKLPFNIQSLIISNLLELIEKYANDEYEQDLQAYNKELEEIEKEKNNVKNKESK